MRALLDRAKTTFAGRRAAWPWFDHLIRAGKRYKIDHGDRLAAALTMYAILALLPMLLLATSILGFVLENDPETRAAVFDKVTGAIPGVGSQLSEALIAVRDNRGTIGLVGIAGLLFSGLGGVDALRDSLRLMWHHNVDAGNFFKKKGVDVVTVLILTLTLGVSFAISALATGGTGVLLERASITGGFAAAILSVLSFVVGVGVDAAMFLVLFKWLPKVDWPWRRLVRGALFGGVSFGVLKLAGAWYVGRTATKSTALYGSIGTAVAVLVGLYLVSRVILFTAAWTVTAPGWDDVEPSGTASERAAREADIPVEAARGNGRHVPHRMDPVGASLDVEADVERGSRSPRPVRVPLTVGAAPREPSGSVATRAAQGFAATGLALLGFRGLRALRRG